MKKALIFGITGQDGAFLAQLLLEKNYQVIGVTRRSTDIVFPNLHRLKIINHLVLVSGSMGSSEEITSLINRYRPCEIYNLAGQSSVSRSFEIPGETFESISGAVNNLLEAALVMKSPVKIFNAGSGDIFGDMGERRATEGAAPSPLSPYAKAKASAFRRIAMFRKIHGMFACTGILFNHESYLRPKQFVTRKIVTAACSIARGRSRELFLGNTGIKRDWGWAPEYVDAMWRMLQQKIPEDYIIATGTTMGLEDFVSAVFMHLGLDWRDHVKTDNPLVRPVDIPAMYADPAKAYRQLAWKARYTGYDVAKMMVDAELAENRT